MTVVPVDGWCIQVFHLSDAGSPLQVLAAVQDALGGDATAFAPADSLQVVVETADDPSLVTEAERVVRATDPEATRVHLSRGTLEPAPAPDAAA